MPPKSFNWKLYAKMISSGAILCIGGPYLVWYVTPTEEALFARYNPELQKRSLENRIGRQEDFDHFVGKLKEYSKSDRPIWEAAARDERSKREGRFVEQERLVEEMRRRKAELKRED